MLDLILAAVWLVIALVAATGIWLYLLFSLPWRKIWDDLWDYLMDRKA